MKQRKRRIWFCSLAAVILVGVSAVGVLHASALTTEKLSGMEETSRISRVEKLSTQQLIGLLNGDKSVRANDLSMANEGLYTVAAELLERKDAISNTELLGQITNPSNQIQTRSILMDLYAIKNENMPKAELKELLVSQGGQLPAELKVKAITDAVFTEEDIPLLKSYVEEEDEIVAFHGLKKLSTVNLSEAAAVSDEILSTYPVQPSQKISAAQKVKSKFYLNYPNASGKKEFIALCVQIAEENPQDTILRDSSTFALSALRDYSAVEAIVNSPVLDRISKVAAVNENFMTLWDVLKESPSEQDIAFVITCMEIHPIKDLADDLERALETVKDRAVQSRGHAVVEKMRGPEGIEANDKWVS